MSFIKLVERETVSLNLNEVQKSVIREYETLDWTFESVDDKPVLQRPGTDAKFEITEDGKLREV